MLTSIIKPRASAASLEDPVELQLINVVKGFIENSVGRAITSRELGRMLQATELEDNKSNDALDYVKSHHETLSKFLQTYESIFTADYSNDNLFPDFMITIAVDGSESDYDEDDNDDFEAEMRGEAMKGRGDNSWISRKTHGGL